MMPSLRLGVFAALSCVLVACASSSGGASSPTAPTTPTPATSVAGCEVTESTPGTPVGVDGGPYTHNVAIGFSTDGVTVTGLTEVRAHASVPDGVQLPDGSTGIYYVNGETSGVWLGKLTGTTLTPVSAITIDGVFRPDGVVDPDATLVNGKVRLAYLNGFGPPGAKRRAMCLAESSDGLNFRTLAMAWDVGLNQQQTDPSMVQLPDGTWLMAMRDENIVRLGRSSSGLAFTEYMQLDLLGVVELGLTTDGRVRIYSCVGGITSHVSADKGVTWTAERTVVPGGSLGRRIVCDPSWVPSAGLFVFKTE